MGVWWARVQGSGVSSCVQAPYTERGVVRAPKAEVSAWEGKETGWTLPGVPRGWARPAALSTVSHGRLGLSGGRAPGAPNLGRVWLLSTRSCGEHSARPRPLLSPPAPPVPGATRPWGERFRSPTLVVLEEEVRGDPEHGLVRSGGHRPPRGGRRPPWVRVFQEAHTSRAQSARGEICSI